MSSRQFLTLEREQVRRFDASWGQSKPAVEAALTVLQESGIDNLYWIGTRALGTNKSKEEPFQYVLPPDTTPSLGVALASKIAGLMSTLVGTECSVQLWQALSIDLQRFWSVKAVPLFAAVAPADLLKDPLSDQR